MPGAARGGRRIERRGCLEETGKRQSVHLSFHHPRHGNVHAMKAWYPIQAAVKCSSRAGQAKEFCPRPPACPACRHARDALAGVRRAYSVQQCWWWVAPGRCPETFFYSNHASPSIAPHCPPRQVHVALGVGCAVKVKRMSLSVQDVFGNKAGWFTCRSRSNQQRAVERRAPRLWRRLMAHTTAPAAASTASPQQDGTRGICARAAQVAS